MTINEMMDKLKGTVNNKRFIHSVNVMNCAIELARVFGVDEKKAGIAGLLHDCAKSMKSDTTLKLFEKYNIKLDDITRLQPNLLHGPLGSKIAQDEYGVEDPDILSAIFYHTTGHENMSMLEKITLMADYIEPGRHFPEIEEVRKVILEDINKAIIMSLDRTIKYVLYKGGLLHPLTINTRNYLIAEKMGRTNNIMI